MAEEVTMPLYPTLEDMKVDQMVRAQLAQMPELGMPAAEASAPVYSHHPPSVSAYPPPPAYPTTPVSVPIQGNKYASLYPDLDDYMGLQLSRNAEHYGLPPTAVVPAQPSTVALPSQSNGVIAPISGNSVGLARARVSHDLREVTLCKDGHNKVGLRVQPVNKGVFVILVQKNTPAAMAGLRFGDQILMINDEAVAGFSMDKVHSIIKKSNPNRITMVVRDRPFERTVTIHKDSLGHVGFGFKNGKVINIVKDSSAARNGLLIDHNLLEINGQNVVSLKDKEVTEIIKNGGNIITLTIMPSFVFDHMMKNTASSFIKKTMDHSIPDL